MYETLDLDAWGSKPFASQHQMTSALGYRNQDGLLLMSVDTAFRKAVENKIALSSNIGVTATVYDREETHEIQSGTQVQTELQAQQEATREEAEAALLKSLGPLSVRPEARKPEKIDADKGYGFQSRD
jgi:hypothetical protein